MNATALLTKRYVDALAYAARLHRSQVRKGSGVPYIAHLLSVSALVLEHGGSEDQAIAALLHDSVEDQGGAATRAEIAARFGEHVACLVDGCTDTDQTPKPPWQQRKDDYLAHLEHADPEVLLISLADKLHNARSVLDDYRAQGEAVWERFKGGRAGSLWYYRALADIFARRGHPVLTAELERVVREIERLAASS